ncbi:MAG TPA: NAD(P)/FAD-dependent oxidoreductase [Candidatus Eisenbacteria bacterium]|jgi:flavin-dependent dehydrogenase|nr:NAD(P)/FAD-dependent oxidoreductase [Candidatus Eisenbacteria bacterium]
MTEYDVAVSGGGPAGSALAAYLARRGRRVLLVERGSPGRGRVCGGFLGPEIFPLLEMIGMAGAEPPSASLDRLVLSHGRTGVFERRLPGRGLGVERSRFDAWLFGRARLAGADVREEATLDASSAGGARVLRIVPVSGAPEEVRARFLVRAHGRRAVRASGRPPFFGCKSVYRNVRGLDGAVALHFVRRANVGFNSLGEGRTALCLYADGAHLRAAHGDLDGMVRSFARENPWIARQLEGAERAGDWTSCQAEPDGREIFYEEGSFHVGDAVAMMHPLVGGGITLAMSSAVVLGRLLAGAPGGEPDAEIARRYRRGWKRAFGRPIRWGNALGFLQGSDGLTASALGWMKRNRALLELVVRRSRPRPGGGP